MTLLHRQRGPLWSRVTMLRLMASETCLVSLLASSCFRPRSPHDYGTWEPLCGSVGQTAVYTEPGGCRPRGLQLARSRCSPRGGRERLSCCPLCGPGTLNAGLWCVTGPSVSMSISLQHTISISDGNPLVVLDRVIVCHISPVC